MTKKLKSFVVKTARIKNGKDNRGGNNFISYLLNENVAAHKDTKIIQFGNEEKNSFVRRINEMAEQKNYGCKTKIKSNFQSFTFNLPNGINCSEEQWKILNEKVLDLLEKEIGVDRKNVFSVLHEEKHSNSHLNIAVSRIGYKDGKLVSINELDQKKILFLTKQVFNDFVKNDLNYNIEDYVVQDRYQGKDMPLWKCRIEEQRQELAVIDMVDYRSTKVVEEAERNIKQVYEKDLVETRQALTQSMFNSAVDRIKDEELRKQMETRIEKLIELSNERHKKTVDAAKSEIKELKKENKELKNSIWFKAIETFRNITKRTDKKIEKRIENNDLSVSDIEIKKDIDKIIEERVKELEETTYKGELKSEDKVSEYKQMVETKANAGLVLSKQVGSFLTEVKDFREVVKGVNGIQNWICGENKRKDFGDNLEAVYQCVLAAAKTDNYIISRQDFKNAEGKERQSLEGAFDCLATVLEENGFVDKQPGTRIDNQVLYFKNKDDQKYYVGHADGRITFTGTIDCKEVVKRMGNLKEGFSVKFADYLKNIDANKFACGTYKFSEEFVNVIKSETAEDLETAKQKLKEKQEQIAVIKETTKEEVKKNIKNTTDTYRNNNHWKNKKNDTSNNLNNGLKLK